MLLTDATPSPSPRRLSDDTQRQLLARYQRSDPTQRAFCAQVGIPVSTLQWWLVKTRRQAARDTPVTFTEVSLPAVAQAQADRGVGTPWAVEIRTDHGVTLRLREPVAPADLVALLRGARC